MQTSELVGYLFMQGEATPDDFLTLKTSRTYITVNLKFMLCIFGFVKPALRMICRRGYKTQLLSVCKDTVLALPTLWDV